MTTCSEPRATISPEIKDDGTGNHHPIGPCKVMKKVAIKRERPITSFFAPLKLQRTTAMPKDEVAHSSSASSPAPLTLPIGGSSAPPSPPNLQKPPSLPADVQRAATALAPDGNGNRATAGVGGCDSDKDEEATTLVASVTDAFAAANTDDRLRDPSAENDTNNLPDKHPMPAVPNQEPEAEPLVDARSRKDTKSQRKNESALVSQDRLRRIKQQYNSRNVAHLLCQRATWPANGRRCPPPMQLPLAWRSTPWIHLDSGSHPHTARTALASGISTAGCRLAWDALGVLLAAASPIDRWIRVYDWDMVRSADRQGRSHRTRHRAATAATAGVFVVEPILAFPVRPAVATNGNSPRPGSSTASCLTWNPFREDELAVGTYEGEAVVYDLGTDFVGGAPSHQVYSAGVVPARGTAAGVSALAFVHDGRHLLLACDAMVRCVDVATSQTVWMWTWSGAGTITALEPVPRTDLLVLGSSLGYLAVLDSSKLERHAFSQTVSPAVLGSWLSYQGLSTPGGSYMGIRHLSIRHLPIHHENLTAHQQLPDLVALTVTWVASCGWALRSSFRVGPSAIQRLTASAVHTTRPVEYLNAEGESVPGRCKGAAGAWSLPAGSSVAAAGDSSGLLVWERVPDVRQVLPPADKRVIPSQPRLLRDDRGPGLWLLPSASSPSSSLYPQPIKLSKRWDAPLALSVHPHQDYIVVATKAGLFTLAPRGIASNSGHQRSGYRN